jgi:hypothetical protein
MKLVKKSKLLYDWRFTANHFFLASSPLEIGMICSAKPVQTEDLCVVQKEEFSVTCCMREMYT